MNKAVRKFLFLLMSAALLSGCSVSSTSSDSQSQSDSSSSDEPAKTYEKDEEGFYILEDDYYSYTEDGSDTKLKSKVIIPDLVEDQPAYTQMRMYIGDKSVPIYNVKTNYSHRWDGAAPNRMNNAVATIGLEGRATVKLQTNFSILDRVTIRPTDAEVPYTIDENRRVLSFEITTPGQYTVEFRNDRTLHFFVNTPEQMSNPFGDDAIVFGPGIHTHANDSRINSSNIINVYSNQKIYIAPNAIIYGSIRAYNASNVTIAGCGYIDGSTFDRNANTGTVLVPIDFDYCSNITFKDFAVTDPAGWCFNIYFCSDVTITNTKIISSRSNGDGISIQSCKRVNVSDCFVRTWDDSLVVKNYPEWSNRSSQGVTQNVSFSNCIVWTDLAQSMEIGYETVGQTMDTITFSNITVLHNYHKAVFSIHNGNNANIKNVKFENITVEDAAMGKGDGEQILVDIQNVYSSTWSDQHAVTSLGTIDTVNLKNIKVVSGIDNPIVKVKGCVDPREGYSKDPHYISNVTFTNFWLYDSFLTSSYSNYQTEYASNVSFKEEAYTTLGSTIAKNDVSGYGNNIIFG